MHTGNDNQDVCAGRTLQSNLISKAKQSKGFTECQGAKLQRLDWWDRRLSSDLRNWDGTKKFLGKGSSSVSLAIFWWGQPGLSSGVEFCSYFPQIQIQIRAYLISKSTMPTKREHIRVTTPRCQYTGIVEHPGHHGYPGPPSRGRSSRR